MIINVIILVPHELEFEIFICAESVHNLGMHTIFFFYFLFIKLINYN